MNVETLNSYFRVMENTSNIPHVRKILSKASSWPVFHIAMPEIAPKMTDHEDMDLLRCENKMTIPFPCIKIIDSNPDLHGNDHAWGFISDNGSIVIYNFVKTSEFVSAFRAVLSEKHIIETIDQNNPKKIVELYGDGMILFPRYKVLELDKNDESIRSIFVELRNQFINFLSTVNCPRHFISKVSPSNSKGRSVEWVARKSRYIILGPEHAKQVISGEQKSFDGTITRAMHNRRAHFRRLTSEKFTKKRGLKIWVKSSWVGPTDWNDNQGNAYKIINPNRS